MTIPRTLAFTVAVAAGALLVAGCSTDNAVSQDEVEAQAEEQLASEVDGAAPDVSCPGDLDAEEGATMECELTVEGDETVYPVSIEVTSVEGDTANFSIEVGEPG